MSSALKHVNILKMELSFIALFSITIGLAIVFFFVYFAIRAYKKYHDLSSNIGPVFTGSLVAGAGLGIMLGVTMCCVLPTYHIVTKITTYRNCTYNGMQVNGSLDIGQHCTRYVLNGRFWSEYGRTFVDNRSEKELVIAIMTYGNEELSKDQSPRTPVLPGKVVKVNCGIDGWFEQFPNTVSSKGSGGKRCHVLTNDQLFMWYYF